MTQLSGLITKLYYYYHYIKCYLSQIPHIQGTIPSKQLIKGGYQFTTRRSNNTLSPEVTSVVATSGTSSAKTTAKPLGTPQLVIDNPQNGPNPLTR